MTACMPSAAPIAPDEPDHADTGAGLIAALRRRNEELAEALARSRAAERRSIAALAMVSHELRTPLNAVSGFVEAALHGVRGPLPEPYRDYLADVLAVGRHLEALVDDLLDFAQLEGGGFRVDRRAVGARGLIAGARAMVTPTAQRRGIPVAPPVPGRDWTIVADPLRARQILVNLLTNALKFAPAGAEVGVEAQEAPGERLAITVWDTGHGIALPDQDRIFEAFERGSGRGTPEAKGIGLGLAISRQLARAMAGDLTLASVPGHGARFTLALPLARRAGDAASARAGAHPGDGPGDTPENT